MSAPVSPSALTPRAWPCHDILVHESSIDHRHDLEHVSIRDTSSIYHLRLNAQCRSYLRSPASTSVHKHLRTLDLRKAIQEVIETGLIFNDGSANLDNCEILHVSFFI